MWYDDVMKNLLLVFAALLLSGCLDDPTVDVSRLSKHDRVLFSAAAAIESVDVTTESRPWYWTVHYGGAKGRSGWATWKSNALYPFCEIRLSKNMVPCKTGGRDQIVFTTSRHEIRHCKNQNNNHNSDPDSLMYDTIPCWPD